MSFDTNGSTLVVISGELWVCGKNDYGQLGVGHKEDVRTFTRIESEFTKLGIKQVKSGYTHSLVLTNSGEVYGAGNNQSFQLGLHDNLNGSTTFIKLPIENVQKVECSGNFCMAISENNLYIWGHIFKHQYGHYQFTMPTKIISTQYNEVYNIFSGSTSDQTNFIIETNNGIFLSKKITHEDNLFVKLNLNNNYSTIDIKFNWDAILLLSKNLDGEINLHRYDWDMQKFKIEKDIKLNNPKIFANIFKTYILNENSKDIIRFKPSHKNIIPYKDNMNLPTIINDIILGHEHIFYIMSDDKVYCKGRNNSYELGLGHNLTIEHLVEHPFLSGKGLERYPKINKVKNARSYI